MGYEFIKLKKEDGIAILTLDRPPVNALSTQMIQEIGRAMDDLEGDGDVKVVIITGAGNLAFAAGADVKEMQTIDASKAGEVIKNAHTVFNKIEKSSKPVICALNGMAIGGGNELAMTCDIRVCTDRAKFSQPEVTLGLIPGYGGTQRLARLIGRAKAKEMCFTGDLITAQEAYRIGFVNKVVPDGEELRAAKDIARKIITKASPIALSLCKKAINEGIDRHINEGLDIEARYIEKAIHTEDAKEGIRAFIEKRQPKFTGK